MLFLASKLFWTVAQPATLLLLLLAVGVIRLWLSGRRKGLILVSAVTAIFFAAVSLPVGNLLIGPLEARFPQPSLPAQIEGIILLGGAVDTAMTLVHHQPALNEAAERITETVVLARRYPAARVLISGGNGEMVPTGLTEAQIMRDLLVSLGVDPARLLLEDRSRNSWENAVLSKRVAQPEPGQVWLLVTSAFHMPRAVGCFRQAGFPVLPYPVDYRTGMGWTPDAFNLAARLATLSLAAREWVGLLVYRLLGRSSALFPAPIA